MPRAGTWIPGTADGSTGREPTRHRHGLPPPRIAAEALPRRPTEITRLPGNRGGHRLAMGTGVTGVTGPRSLLEQPGCSHDVEQQPYERRNTATNRRYEAHCRCNHESSVLLVATRRPNVSSPRLPLNPSHWINVRYDVLGQSPHRIYIHTDTSSLSSHTPQRG